MLRKCCLAVVYGFRLTLPVNLCWPLQVNLILKEATSNGLQVVPLVQTFGHMEFVLKHDAFASCREVPDGYMDICPLHSESANLVQTIVTQVCSEDAGVLVGNRLTTSRT
jgi:hypothetical protein